MAFHSRGIITHSYINCSEKLTEVGVSFDPDSFMSTILELLGNLYSVTHC